MSNGNHTPSRRTALKTLGGALTLGGFAGAASGQQSGGIVYTLKDPEQWDVAIRN
jgi:hypothetical protein